MIKKIYSKINPSILLHVIYASENDKEIIRDKAVIPITETNHSIQAMAFKMAAGVKSNPHRHNNYERKTNQTHEALVLLSGKIELSIYDIDNNLLEKHELNEGDCYVYINGGHSIRAITNITFFEFKNGPYGGPEKDKTAI